MELEPNTKLREWQVKERWGIDQNKLAEYVYKDNLRAYDINGRQIRFLDLYVAAQMEILATLKDGKKLDLDDALENQLIIFAPLIAQFISDDIIDFEREYNLYNIPQTTPTKESTPAPQAKPQAENYFKQSGDFWTIRFQGNESTPIKAVKGLLYISCLLERPGKSVSCIELDSVANKNKPKSISLTEAKSEGLHTGHKRERINSFEANQQLMKEQLRLENELQDINDMDEQEITLEEEFRKKEIKEELDKLYSLEGAKFFADEISKKQSLVIRNLQTAYAHIEKDRNMAKCVEYLSSHIAPDGASGYMYNGDIKWDVILM